MVNEEPKVIPSARYELREAAEILGVSPTTLSKWTNEGKIKYGIKKVNGRRFWLGSELLRAWRMSM